MKKLFVLLLALMLLPLPGLAEESLLPAGLKWGMSRTQVDGVLGRLPEKGDALGTHVSPQGERLYTEYWEYSGVTFMGRPVMLKCYFCGSRLTMLAVGSFDEQLSAGAVREALVSIFGEAEPAGVDVQRAITTALMGTPWRTEWVFSGGERWQVASDTQLWLMANDDAAAMMMFNVDAGDAPVAPPAEEDVP